MSPDTIRLMGEDPIRNGVEKMLWFVKLDKDNYVEAATWIVQKLDDAFTSVERSVSRLRGIDGLALRDVIRKAEAGAYAGRWENIGLDAIHSQAFPSAEVIKASTTRGLKSKYLGRPNIFSVIQTRLQADIHMGRMEPRSNSEKQMSFLGAFIPWHLDRRSGHGGQGSREEAGGA